MTLVLLHPIGLDSGCWQFLPLADQLALDLPGHGHRPGPAGRLDLGGMADDVVAQLDAHGLTEVDLVGLSLGGAVGLHLAHRHPRRLRSLVLACTSAATDPAALEERARAAETTGMAGVLDATLERWFSPPALAAPDHPGVGYARRRLLAADPRVFADAWRALGRHQMTDALPGIAVPVTAVAGAGDRAAPVGNLRRIAEGVPRGRLTVVEGPHMLQLESAPALAGVIENHLAWVDAAPAHRSGPAGPTGTRPPQP